MQIIQDLSQQEKIKLTISSLGLGYFIYQFYKKVKKLDQIKNEQREIRQTRVYRPQEIKQKFLNLDSGIQEQYVRIDNNTLKYKNILIQGISYSDSPIPSIFPQNTNQESLLYRKSISLKKYSNQGFFKSCHIIPNSFTDILKYMKSHKKEVLEKQVDNFMIFDPNKTQEICKVNLNSDIPIGQSRYQQNDKPVILDSCFDYYEFNSSTNTLSFFKQLLYPILALQQLLIWPINILFSKQPLIKGVEIGQEHYEIGIRSGRVITVFGDLLFDLTNRTISIENPIYIMKDRRGILKYLQTKIVEYRMQVFLTIVPLIGISLYIGKIIYNVNKKRTQFKRDNKYKHMKNLEEIDQDISDEMKCIICIDRARSIILKPCLHTLMCRQCLKVISLQKNQCPICKVRIQDFVEILVENK